MNNWSSSTKARQNRFDPSAILTKKLKMCGLLYRKIIYDQSSTYEKVWAKL
jgi:hypothetical protein